MQALAHRAVTSLEIAILLTLPTYALSFRRHRALLVEGMPHAAADGRRASIALETLRPNPREQAAASFILKTFAASSQQRMILSAYGGFGVAVLLTGILGVRNLFPPERLSAAYFVYSHVILLSLPLIGLRHLFSAPTELRQMDLPNRGTPGAARLDARCRPPAPVRRYRAPRGAAARRACPTVTLENQADNQSTRRPFIR